ncbi:MAG: hypothetical protein ACR2OE_09475 [Thermomicrobiales bacterium]
MDRITLTDYLANEYDSLMLEAGIAATDTVDGLASVLNAVQDIVIVRPDLSVVWQRLLGSYYLLDRILNKFAVNMNVSISGDSYSLQQQFANVKALRDEAYRNVAWLIVPVSVPGPRGMGSVGIVSALSVRVVP